MADNNTTQNNLQNITTGFDVTMAMIGTTALLRELGATGIAGTGGKLFSATFGIVNNTINGVISFGGSEQERADLEKVLVGVEVNTVVGIAVVSVLTTLVAGTSIVAAAPVVIIGAGLVALDVSLWGDELYAWYKEYLRDPIIDWMIKNNYDLEIRDAVNDLWKHFKNWIMPRRDPLVLDLDGDGIETLGITSTTQVLFDFDGDGVKTGTGWIKGDDGFLVLDRNGNGTIDNGGELFGDQTLVNGQTAANGFAALAAEDTNGNGIFDSGDANFANVQVWRDINADGISQAGELYKLSDLGIVSIDLTSTTTAKTTNGNVQTASGTFTRTNGTTGDSGTLELDDGSAGNLNFSQNPFYSEFTDHLTLTDTALALPDMQGSGLVRVNNDKFENARRVV